MRLIGQDVVIVNDRSLSESIGRCRRVRVGLILCYAQALGIVIGGSLLVELSGGWGHATVVPPVVPHKGRTTASGVVVEALGKLGNRPEDWGFTRKGKSVVRGFRHNSLILVQKIKPKA